MVAVELWAEFLDHAGGARVRRGASRDAQPPSTSKGRPVPASAGTASFRFCIHSTDMPKARSKASISLTSNVTLETERLIASVSDRGLPTLVLAMLPKFARVISPRSGDDAGRIRRRRAGNPP